MLQPILVVANHHGCPLLAGWSRIPGIEVTSWNGLVVPSGTPKDIVSKINAEVARITRTPEMKARMVELGFEPMALSVDDTEKFVRADVERWAKVIRDACIKTE